MKTEDEGEYLKGTLEKDNLDQIENIYNELNTKQDKFCNTFNIHCKKNCGECCKHFYPDVTRLEALYVAYGLIKDNKVDWALSLFDEFEKEGKFDHCPFYNDEVHCSIYTIRPLICRLFNAAASTDKLNKPVFRSCKYNDSKYCRNNDDFKVHQEDVITMEEFGEMVQSIDTSSNLPEDFIPAVRKAIAKLQFIIDLKKHSE
jgi:Fe-S-cluster containining protein